VNTALGHKEGVSSKNASMFLLWKWSIGGKLAQILEFIQGWWLNYQSLNLDPIIEAN
jgi:hypothetical protein